LHGGMFATFKGMRRHVEARLAAAGVPLITTSPTKAGAAVVEGVLTDLSRFATSEPWVERAAAAAAAVSTPLRSCEVSPLAPAAPTRTHTHTHSHTHTPCKSCNCPFLVLACSHNSPCCVRVSRVHRLRPRRRAPWRAQSKKERSRGAKEDGEGQNRRHIVQLQSTFQQTNMQRQSYLDALNKTHEAQYFLTVCIFVLIFS
jgi:hypothetical protein